MNATAEEGSKKKRKKKKKKGTVECSVKGSETACPEVTVIPLNKDPGAIPAHLNPAVVVAQSKAMKIMIIHVKYQGKCSIIQLLRFGASAWIA